MNACAIPSFARCTFDTAVVVFELKQKSNNNVNNIIDAVNYD